jgi:hypothetical protein
MLRVPPALGRAQQVVIFVACIVEIPHAGAGHPEVEPRAASDVVLRHVRAKRIFDRPA